MVAMWIERSQLGRSYSGRSCCRAVDGRVKQEERENEAIEPKSGNSKVKVHIIEQLGECHVPVRILRNPAPSVYTV